jgi:hypothetical protein
MVHEKQKQHIKNLVFFSQLQIKIPQHGLSSSFQSDEREINKNSTQFRNKRSYHEIETHIKQNSNKNIIPRFHIFSGIKNVFSEKLRWNRVERALVEIEAAQCGKNWWNVFWYTKYSSINFLTISFSPQRRVRSDNGCWSDLKMWIWHLAKIDLKMIFTYETTRKYDMKVTKRQSYSKWHHLFLLGLHLAVTTTEYVNIYILGSSF